MKSRCSSHAGTDDNDNVCGTGCISETETCCQTGEHSYEACSADDSCVDVYGDLYYDCCALLPSSTAPVIFFRF